MSIHVSSAMVVGCPLADIGLENLPIKTKEEFTKWLEDNNLHDWDKGLFAEFLDETNGIVSLSSHFDADPDDWVVGYIVPSTSYKDMDEYFLKFIKTKAEEFKNTTGCEPILNGFHDVS